MRDSGRSHDGVFNEDAPSGGREVSGRDGPTPIQPSQIGGGATRVDY